MWTNGKQKEVFRKYKNDKGQICFMEYNDIPSADGNLDDINRPSRTSLKNAYDDNLLFVFKTCHNHIHADTFQPRNGTQTSVLFLQKKTQEQKDKEEKSGTMADYNIFMAMVEKIGHDKRGTPIFKRDKEGNEILIPEKNNTFVMDQTADGNTTFAQMRKTKIEDDQTLDVPAIFAEWKNQEGLTW